MRIGIDASNLRSGGVLAHIAELLAHADPARHGITRVTLWASPPMLQRIPNRPWLDRVHIHAFDGSLARRVVWQMFERSRLARASCDVVFAPGATPAGSFRPFVSMSANMLPFSPRDSARYGWSRERLRLILLRMQQATALRKSSAVIFLTDFAREHISPIAGLSSDALVEVIPTGMNARFFSSPRPQRPFASYSPADPFRFIYVSDVHPYKHHANVVEAVSQLRHEGLPVALDMIGVPAHSPSMRRLEFSLSSLNGTSDAIRFLGPTSHDALPPIYRDAGAFVFASTCENLPMTLLEAMAAGLPIAASCTRPMPDILGEAAIAFDSESVPSIGDALRTVAVDHERRAVLAQHAYDAAKRYSWEECADRTFGLLAKVSAVALRK